VHNYSFKFAGCLSKHEFQTCLHIHKKTWSRPFARSTMCRPSHCPSCRNEQRRKPHADVFDTIWRRVRTPQNHNGEQYTSRGVPVALFLTRNLRLRSSHIVKTKAYRYAFYVYVSSHSYNPWGFRHEFQHCKSTQKNSTSITFPSQGCIFRQKLP
jgi:hypothetical protein